MIPTPAVLLPLIVVYVAFALGLRLGLAKLPRRHENRASESATLLGVSVLIPARNEAHSIVRCLLAVLNQDYPRSSLEVVAVDDNSDDETLARMREVADSDARVRVLTAGTIPESISPKKYALTRAIAAAGHDVLVTLDADAAPGRQWLRTMVEPYQPGVGAVIGPVAMRPRGVFARLAALDFWGFVAAGAGLAGLGVPTLAHGANFSYRKQAFEAVRGFEGIANQPSGDDDLLLHKLAASSRWRVEYAWAPGALVDTDPPHSLPAFLAQRIRWASKGAHYVRGWRGLLLGGVWSFYAALLSIPVAVVFHPEFWGPWALAALAKMLADAIVLFPALRRFGQLRLLAWLPLAEALQVAYLPVVTLLGNVTHLRWKDRRFRPTIKREAGHVQPSA